MNSSDSEDDCYGNAAEKLQLILSHKKKEDLHSVSFNDSFNFENSPLVNKPAIKETIEVFDDGGYVLTSEKESRKRAKKTAKAVDDDEVFIVESPPRIRRRAKKTPPEPKKALSSRGRGRGRGRGKNKNIENDATFEISQEDSNRGRNTRNRGRTTNMPSDIETIRRSTRQSRGRNREIQNNIPTYSIGNTADYDDLSHTQKLFTAKPTDIEQDDDLENEELSVKVYWKSAEVIKFQIRKYQKLKQIYDYFSNRENVGHDKLYFTYNDVVVKIDDSPDSIGYNISRFIDGGIVNERLVSSTLQKNVVNGITIKFQCQNEKKPFETTIDSDDKLSVAMLKCAEHFEKPMAELHFFFDGDLISGKSTPKDLDLADGECIDVKNVR